MKGFITILILAVVIIGGYTLLKKPVEAPRPEEAADMNPASPSSEDTIAGNTSGTKEFDTTKSEATWTGSKTIIKDYYDHGTINIKSGNAVFANGILTGGTVVFDMNSIATTSTGRGSDADTTSKLAGHLKSEAFFDTAKYPEATFTVKSAAKESDTSYIVSGDLTIKGTTNPVSFPVEVTQEGGAIVVSGSTEIDRTLWDVRFGSTKFFQDLGDNVINDMFTLEFRAVTK